MKGFKKQSIYIKSQGVLKDRPSGRGLALAGLPEVPGCGRGCRAGVRACECVHERAPERHPHRALDRATRTPLDFTLQPGSSRSRCPGSHKFSKGLRFAGGGALKFSLNPFVGV